MTPVQIPPLAAQKPVKRPAIRIREAVVRAYLVAGLYYAAQIYMEAGK